MALETMLGVTEIDGLKVISVEEADKLDDQLPLDVFVAVDHDVNALIFKLQDGPIKENGLNGCQVTDIVKVAKHIFERLNEKFHCQENDNTIHYLQLALYQQETRTKNREARGVEGLSKQ